MIPAFLRKAYIKYLLCLAALTAAWLHGFWTAVGVAQLVIEAKKGVL